MKHMKKFNEEFEEMKKPSMLRSGWDKLVKSTKQTFGIENKEDRNSLDEIHRIINFAKNNDYADMVSSVREIKEGVIVAWLNKNSLTVDTINNEIIYKGKNLEVGNIEFECEELYFSLRSFL